MYDPALGRFMTIDPLAESYSYQSPYVYAANNPIRYTDFLGMGPYDEILKQVAEQENINIGYNVVHNNETGETTITHTAIQEHPDKFSPIEKGEVNYQQTTTTYSIGSDGELASVSTKTSGLQVSVSAKGEMASDGYNIEGVSETIENMSYADAVHQPDQIKEFARDPIVAGISAIKSNQGLGGDALSRQDTGLPGLTWGDKIQSRAPEAIQLFTRGDSGGLENLFNFDRDRKTTLNISPNRVQKAAKKLKRLSKKVYPIIM